MRLRKKMLIVSILPIIFLGILTIIVARFEMKKIATTQLNTTLEATAVTALEVYQSKNDEPYSRDENGKVWKGDYCISDDFSVIDAIHDNTDLECTFFYGDERIVTTILDEQGERIVGTTIKPEVAATIAKGQAFYKTIDINNQAYNTYYFPIYQVGSDSEIIGCFFVGQSTSILDKSINDIMIKFILFIIVVVFICGALMFIIVGRISKSLQHGVEVVKEVASGNLNVDVATEFLGKKDEAGVLATEINRLKNDLRNVLNQISEDSRLIISSSQDLLDTATDTAATIEQVDHAVQDIAEGAASQAMETQNAAAIVNDMGEMITATAVVVEKLSDNAGEMKASSNEASDIIVLLEQTNIKTRNAIEVIYQQTNTTNVSALKIKEATDLITSIAEETNLLSLNASIEAARAGEQGRGFAVVAAQIQKLAEQSNESASRIGSIIDALIKDSNKAVDTMEEVKHIIEEQTVNVDKTEEIFESVKEGIDSSIDSIESIYEHTRGIEIAKDKVIDTVQDLTAIAQENAASAEETSAATNQVSTSVSKVAETAEILTEIAHALEESISIFKL